MKAFLEAARLLLADMASTLFFLVLFLLTHNTILSVGLGMALGITQIGIQIVRRRPIHIMEWLSLFLVIAAGSATLLTNDPRFVLLKPSVIYVIVGSVMLKAGWLNRYLPDIARAVAPDVAVITGFVWAGLMFVSAAVNAFVALACSVSTWAMIMPVYGMASKAAVFLAGFLAIRFTVIRRLRAMPAYEREALLGAMARPGEAPSLARPG
jgi:intracellular septation protein A